MESDMEAVGKTILAIVPSLAERYLSTALFEGIESCPTSRDGQEP
jgi:hypothetical protein